MRKAIWNSMLTADGNFRYWKQVTLKYLRKDKYTKIFLAITSSSIIIGWIAGLIATSEWWAVYVSVAWKICSGGNVLVAIILPFMKYEETIKTASFLFGNWWKLKEEYEDMWRRVNDGEENGIEEQYKSIKTREGGLVEQEAHIPENEQLKNEVYQEMLVKASSLH